MTAISWTHRPGSKGVTWNPMRGCTRVSEGCRNCYAEAQAGSRGLSNPGKPYHELVKMTARGPRWTGAIDCDEIKLREPLSWQARCPRTCFVNSMSDAFHERAPEDFLDRLFAVMALSPAHVFIILTKRATRMRAYVSTLRGRASNIAEAASLLGPLEDPDGTEILVERAMERWPLPNVWLGVSAENQAALDERAPDLLATPAAVRVLSLEPLIGPVNIRPYLPRMEFSENYTVGEFPDIYPGIDQAIVGGESERGHQHARPTHPAWVADIQRACADAGVAFFFKQRGAFKPIAPFGRPTAAVARDYTAAMGMREAGLKSHAPIMDIDGRFHNEDSARDAPDPWLFERDTDTQKDATWRGQIHHAWPDTTVRGAAA